MIKPDWKDSPTWADRLVDGGSGDYYWCNVEQYCPVQGLWDSGRVFGLALALKIEDFELVEMRPDPWKEGEERMAVIPQNGNDGEHYEEVDNLEKQPRYTDEDGLDWIDEFAANNSIEDFRAAMRFTIGKYDRRLGKKDELSKELYKISDYYQRWSKIEKELESK
jgi:hypothetical protein